MVRESILERKTPTNGDYGLGFLSVARPDKSSGVGVAEIAVAGTRSVPFIGDFSTDAASPFVGSPIVWTSIDATQFFLSTASFQWGRSPAYITYDSPEAATDYSNDPRPSVGSGLRDKGGEEL
jgi:hypothetical protein